jgi:hypothetical protein
MRDKDQILLEKAFDQVEEGIFDRMKAKSGTRLASLGNKALGGIAKVAGDTRLGRTAGNLQQQGNMDVEEQRAGQLTANLSQKLESLYNEFKTDAQKIGIDVEKLAGEDFRSKGEGGKYPELAGLSGFLRHFNQAKDSLQGASPAA